MSERLVIVLMRAVGLASALLLAGVLWRASHPANPHEAVLAEMTRAHTDAAARLEAMVGMLVNGQGQMQRAVNERLDSVTHRLGKSLTKTTAHTTEHLQKLNERLAVIDSAQKNITSLASQVTSLQGILPTSSRAAPSDNGAWKPSSRTRCRKIPTNSNSR